MAVHTTPSTAPGTTPALRRGEALHCVPGTARDPGRPSPPGSAAQYRRIAFPGGSPLATALPAVRDTTTGRLLLVRDDGSVEEIDNTLPGAADLGLRPNDSVAGVPQLRSHTVRFLGLSIASACLGSRCAGADPPIGRLG
ncbi:MAG: hypothetical protein ACRDV9_06435 [Acidimicrobiia bacterium]